MLRSKPEIITSALSNLARDNMAKPSRSPAGVSAMLRKAKQADQKKKEQIKKQRESLQSQGEYFRQEAKNRIKNHLRQGSQDKSSSPVVSTPVVSTPVAPIPVGPIPTTPLQHNLARRKVS